MYPLHIYIDICNHQHLLRPPLTCPKPSAEASPNLDAQRPKGRRGMKMDEIYLDAMVSYGFTMVQYGFIWFYYGSIWFNVV